MRSAVRPRATVRCSPRPAPCTSTGSIRSCAPTWSRVAERPCCCARAPSARPDRGSPPVRAASADTWGSRGGTTERTRSRGTASRSDCRPFGRVESGSVPASESERPWSDPSATRSRTNRPSRDPVPGRLLQLLPVVAAPSGRIPEAARRADVLLSVVGVAAAATADDVDNLSSPTRRCSLSHVRLPTVRCR
jgi:hypothetical protein